MLIFQSVNFSYRFKVISIKYGTTKFSNISVVEWVPFILRSQPDWVTSFHQPPLQSSVSRRINLTRSLVATGPHFSSQPQMHHPDWIFGCHRPPLQFSASRCIILSGPLVAISPHFSSQPQDASSWPNLWLPSAPTSVLNLKTHHPDRISGCHLPPLQFSTSRFIILSGPLVATSPHFSSQPQDASSWLNLWLPSAPTSVLSLKMHHPEWVSGCHQPPLQFSASICIILSGSLVAISPHFSSQPQDASSWLNLWFPSAPTSVLGLKAHHPDRGSGCHQPPVQFSASRRIILTESLVSISPHFSSRPQGPSSWLRLWLPSAPTSVLSLKMHHPEWVFSCCQPRHIND